ncbi:AP-4 complex subunit mu-1-like isoform X2 [Uloborus diversus]|uniref:AP-4 complex subunit mu-1-like isoform X2 n=1 Tax=Uloborus diversus TaxID=327109 RepID=UPI00240A95CA|nr:AP-4 complex subunit mu-1-like isoform X2 [Uloborus diversus]
MISVFCILTARGDKILENTYRSDITEAQLSAVLQSGIKSKSAATHSCFEVNNVYGFYIKREKLIYLVVCKSKIANVLVLHFLESFYSLVRNYCGGAAEDNITKNLVLVHELMNESVDNGYIKSTNTEQLRPFIYSDPVIVKSSQKYEIRKPGPFGMEKVFVPSTAANQPIVKSRSQQDMKCAEVFLDVIEKLTAHFSREGLVQKFSLNGVIQLKSFITFNHQLNISLDDTVSANEPRKRVMFDQYHFEKCVEDKDFEKNSSFLIQPSQGEIKAMLYSVENPVLLPFRLLANIQTSESNRDCDLTLKLSCNLPSNVEALNLSLHIPVPSATRNIMQQFSMHENSAEFLSKERKILWKIKKLTGQGEVIAKFKKIRILFIREGVEDPC